MSHARIVVIGASAGGFEAVRAVLAGQALLRRRMVDRAKHRGLANLASTWRDEADEAEARGEEIRRLIAGVVSADGEPRRVSRRRK